MWASQPQNCPDNNPPGRQRHTAITILDAAANAPQFIGLGLDPLKILRVKKLTNRTFSPQNRVCSVKTRFAPSETSKETPFASRENPFPSKQTTFPSKEKPFASK